MNRWLQLFAAGRGVRQWAIAKEIGVAEETLCRWLRRELSEERKQRILIAIDKLAKGEFDELSR